jgi:DNA polymerase-3 subunit beta
MKFDVSSTALLSRLQSISKVIASKNSLPVLDCFLFELEEHKLIITASDTDTRMVTSVGVTNAEGTGLFAVTAKILLDPLKELPEQPLVFEINDESLEILIHFENGKYNFIGQKGDTYPDRKSVV